MYHRFGSPGVSRHRLLVLIGILILAVALSASPRGAGRAAAQEGSQPVTPAQAPGFAGRITYVPLAQHPPRATPNATAWITASAARINPTSYFGLTIYAKNTSTVPEPVVTVLVSWNTRQATFESSHTGPGDYVATQSNGLTVVFGRPLAPGETRYATVSLKVRAGVANTDIQLAGSYSASANRAGNLNKITVFVNPTVSPPRPNPYNPGTRLACEFGRGGQGPLGQNPAAGNNPFGTTFTFGAFRRSNGGCGFTFAPGARVSWWVAQPGDVRSVPVGVYGYADTYGEVELRYTTTPLLNACPGNLCPFAMNAASDNSYVLVAPFNLTRPARAEMSSSVAAEPAVEPAQVAEDPEGDAGALGGLSGTVTSSAGAPLVGVQVLVIDPTDDELVESTFTAADGTYIIPAGIPSGAYTVLFSTSLDSDPAASAFADETVPVTVTEPEIATLNATLDAGATISGRVTADGSGAGLGEVLVLVYDATLANIVSTTITDATGAYTTDALPSGSYVVQFDPQASADDDVAGYVSEFNNNGALDAAPTPVTVAVPAPLTGVDAGLGRLATSGGIDGRVTGAGGAALPDVSVILRSAADGGQVAVESTDADGGYHFTVPSGSYTVEFFTDLSPSTVTQSYLDGFIGGATPTPITVTAPAITANVNGVLATGGQILGQVTAKDTQAGLEEVFIVITDASGNVVSTAFTDESGTYTTAALTPGAYTLSVQTANSANETTRAYKPATFNATVAGPTSRVTGNIQLSR